MTSIRRLAFSSITGARLIESGLDVVVTGGGGWLGQATLEMLESAFGPQVASRVHVFGASRRALTLRSGTQLEVHPLAELPRLAVGPHLLAHYAFATREFVAELGPVEYISRNEVIASLVGEHVLRSRPVGVFVPSSGAVYLGDDLSTNPYGVLKVRDERRFLDLAEGTGGMSPAPRVVIPRLFNLAGPFLNKPDRYVLGSVIEDIGRGGPVRLTATRPVVRSYVHVADLVDLALVMVGDGPVPDGPFDTAGEREIEVGELAELAISVLDRPDTAIERPPLDGTGPDRYVGDPSAMRSLARSYGVELTPLVRQIEDTARYLGV